eukprot:UN22058
MDSVSKSSDKILEESKMLKTCFGVRFIVLIKVSTKNEESLQESLGVSKTLLETFLILYEFPRSTISLSRKSLRGCLPTYK